jgi:hypothetical protein
MLGRRGRFRFVRYAERYHDLPVGTNQHYAQRDTEYARRVKHTWFFEHAR